MVNSVGPTGSSGRIEGARPQGTQRSSAAAGTETVRTSGEEEPNVPSPASELASLGPPINNAKVDDLRARIAAGTYRVDPNAVAAKMIALDLPAEKS
jgi:negative regulator of flagellin synthesis FlgM